MTDILAAILASLIGTIVAGVFIFILSLQIDLYYLSGVWVVGSVLVYAKNRYNKEQ